MANRESKKSEQVEKFGHGEVMESQPNPHGEQETGETPIQTDHAAGAPQNVSQNPSTVENRLHPSVVQDPSTDSMFNLADPQTRELLEEDSHKDRSARKGGGHPRRRTA